MDKKEIIKEVYKEGKKWQGVLMACYSKEVFTRKDIEDLVIQYHSSKSSVNSIIDELLKNCFITCISTNKRNRYTVTKEGETVLYNNFAGYTYRMSSYLEHSENTDEFVFQKDENDIMKELNMDSSQLQIEEECERIKEVLLDKNDRYGNSSLEPFGLFKSVERESKIEARIEDKLKRIQKFAKEDEKHCKDYYDAIDDLIGYLVLYRIALRE